MQYMLPASNGGFAFYLTDDFSDQVQIPGAMQVTGVNGAPPPPAPQFYPLETTIYV